MTTLITRAELARRGGVKPPSITLLCKKRLKDACHGKKIDIDHASVIEWLESKQVAVIKTSDADKHLMEHWKADRPNGAAELDRIKDMYIIDVVRRFGTEDAYLGWLRSLKMIEDLETAKLKNDKARGAVIDAELVRGHLITMIDATNRRLLGDSVKTIARTVSELSKAGSTAEETEQAVRDLISSQLKNIKKHTLKKLRAARDA